MRSIRLTGHKRRVRRRQSCRRATPRRVAPPCDAFESVGPYLAERAWGTVREDYSRGPTPREYVPHDHARSRAYRRNEDGLLGFSDRHQRISFALALWNGRDPFLKERLFGVSNPQGNHAEDIKECSLEQILGRLRGEFREMPDMRLTLEQVQRVCGIEPPLCELALQTLVETKFLRLGSDGAYMLFGP